MHARTVMLFRLLIQSRRTGFNIMANVFRNEVVLKASDESIAGFINQYFSVEQGCKFIDFEKLLPLEGKEPNEVWHSDSDAFNFEVVLAESGVFKFRFDTKSCPPMAIFLNIFKEKDSFQEINIVSCCEHLSEIVKFEGKRNLIITNLQWNGFGKLSRKIIKRIGLSLWGYSKRPNLEEQGFINIGGGQFIKMHFDMTAYQDLYPRFKKA